MLVQVSQSGNVSPRPAIFQQQNYELASFPRTHGAGSLDLPVAEHLKPSTNPSGSSDTGIKRVERGAYPHFTGASKRHGLLTVVPRNPVGMQENVATVSRQESVARRCNVFQPEAVHSSRPWSTDEEAADSRTFGKKANAQTAAQHASAMCWRRCNCCFGRPRCHCSAFLGRRRSHRTGRLPSSRVKTCFWAGAFASSFCTE